MCRIHCIRLDALEKQFFDDKSPAFQKKVLCGVNAVFTAGKIHVLLGENGAGKTTLTSILAGLQQPSSGSIMLDDVPIVFLTPRDAIGAGIAMVHQTLLLAEHFTVYETIVAAAGSFRVADEATKRTGRLFDFSLPIRNCSALERLYTATLCALVHNPSFLILDEPEALLSLDERSAMYAYLRQLAKTGIGIILISHHPAEVFTYADSVLLVSGGKASVITELPTVPLYARPAGTIQRRFDDAAGICMNAISINDQIRRPLFSVSITVARGEICGIIGRREDGIETLEDLLTGFARPNSGTISVNRTYIRHFTPAEFCAAGMGFVPSKKNARSLCATVPVYTVLGITLLRTAGQLIRQKRLIAYADALIAAEGFTHNSRLLASSLSGGMLQRLILRREITRKPAVLVLFEPLQGLDCGSAARFCDMVRDAATSGIAVVIISCDAESCRDVCSVQYRLTDGVLYEA